MHVNELSTKAQDYLKALWDLEERGITPAPMGMLAERVDDKASTATEAAKRLSEAGLVTRRPYAGVVLTDEGRELAVQIVRRHRLTETLLVSVLDYTWDEVHDDAEILEHALSDRLVDRIDAFLGHPARDPHGDPIPSAAGRTDTLSAHTLAEASGTVVVEQVNDHNPTTLRDLAAVGVVPGAAVTILAPTDTGLTVQVAGKAVELDKELLIDVRVKA